MWQYRESVLPLVKLLFYITASTQNWLYIRGKDLCTTSWGINRYWQHMYSSCRINVKHFSKCAQNKLANHTRRAHLLLPESRPLQFVAIKILGPLLKTLHGGQFVLIVVDRCSKLPRAVSKSRTSSSQTASLFLDSSIFTWTLCSVDEKGNAVNK